VRRRVGQLALIIATALAVTGLFVFHGTAIADPSYSLSDPGRAAAAAAWSIGLLFVAYMAGLPDAVRTVRHAVGASFAAPAATVAVASLVQLAAGDALLPRFVVFASVLVMPVVNLMVTLPLVASRGRGVSTALVLASADQLADMARVTERGLPTMMRIADTLPLDPDDPTMADRLRAAVDEHEPDILVVADQLLDNHDLAHVAADLHAHGMRIRTLLSFYEDWFRLVPLSELAEVSLLFDIGEVHSPVYLRLKRLLDVVAGIMLGLALVVAVPFVAIGNLLGNRGPLIYSQPRWASSVRSSAFTSCERWCPIGTLTAPQRLGPPSTILGSRRSASCCASCTSTSFPRRPIFCGATCPSSAPGPSSRPT
jgi:hypothetical protein